MRLKESRKKKSVLGEKSYRFDELQNYFWRSNLCFSFYIYTYRYGKHTHTHTHRRKRAKLHFRNQLKASVRRSSDDIGGFSYGLLFSWRGFSISSVFPRSTIVLELSAIRATRSFLFPIVPDGIIERRERGNPLRNNRAARCFFSLSLSLSVHAARLIYFIGFQPGYQSSKSNNIISLRLPVRGPIPFPFEPGEIPRSEFMADSVATTLYTKVCKGLILTRVHISIAMT